MPGAARDVHVAPDLRAAADGRPGVDHGPARDMRAEIDEARHQHDVGRDVGGMAHDATRHRAKARGGELRFAPAGELRRHLVPPAGAARPARDRAQRIEAERQQHRLLQPLVDPPAAARLLGDPQPAGIERIERRRDRRRAPGRRCPAPIVARCSKASSIARSSAAWSIALVPSVDDHAARALAHRLSEPLRLSTAARCPGHCAAAPDSLDTRAMVDAARSPRRRRPLPTGFLEAVERRRRRARLERRPRAHRAARRRAVGHRARPLAAAAAAGRTSRSSRGCSSCATRERVPVVPQGGNTGLVGAGVPDGSGRPRGALARAPRPDPRGRPAQRHDHRRGGLRARDRPGGRGRGQPPVPARARRPGLVPDRRQPVEQRRRHQRAALRHGARAGARARGGARRRPHLGRPAQPAQGQHRLRPEAAVHRRRGHARRDHRGRAAPAAAPARAPDRLARRALAPGRGGAARRCSASASARP